MTQTSPEEMAPLIAEGVRAAVVNAQRLGLVWLMRLATVEDGADPNAVSATYDGDSEPITMFSTIGPFQTGDRAYVIQVPPAGNYIIGGQNVVIPGGLAALISSTTGSGAIGAETVILTSPDMQWQTGRAYEVIAQSQPAGSIANNTALYSIRRTNLAGTVLATWAAQMNNTPGVSDTVLSRTIIRNNTSINIAENIVLTLAAVGGGTITDGAGATQVRYMEVRDAGAASSYPNAVQI